MSLISLIPTRSVTVFRPAEDFSVSYRNNRNAGTATATITGKGNYKGSKNMTFAIAKAVNPMSLKVANKTISKSSVDKKAQTFKAVTFAKKAQGSVAYKNASNSAVKSAVSVNASTGQITVKKGVKKGTYTLQMTVNTAGNANYKAASKTVKVKVKVA